MNNKTTLTFQQALIATIFITLLSGSLSIWLASQKALSAEQTRVFEISNTTWNMGTSAIFGLLGSKATQLFQSEEQEDDK
jgi:hypothetical protein